MLPEMIMFCQECGEQIKGQFACTCIKCVSKRGAQPPQATNTGSPKLLSVDIVAEEVRDKMKMCRLSAWDRRIINSTYDIIEQQLRASA